MIFVLYEHYVVLFDNLNEAVVCLHKTNVTVSLCV